jgi:hypothetical protein
MRAHKFLPCVVNRPHHGAIYSGAPMAKKPIAPSDEEPGSRPLDDEKHERFADFISKGQADSEAYQMAGFKPDWGNCSGVRHTQIVTGSNSSHQNHLYQRPAQERKVKRENIKLELRFDKIEQSREYVTCSQATREYVLTGLIENCEIALGRR